MGTIKEGDWTPSPLTAKTLDRTVYCIVYGLHFRICQDMVTRSIFERRKGHGGGPRKDLFRLRE